MFPGPDGNDATDQKSVGQSGDGFVVVECVDGQQFGDVDVDENDVAVGVERCLKSKPKFYIKIRVEGDRGQFCKINAAINLSQNLLLNGLKYHSK